MKNGHTTRQKAPAGRYALLDELRGLDLVSMMLYHACWDMMFLFGIWMDWYAGMPGRLWQQTICWVFILLWPAAVAVFVLGGVLPAQGGGPQTHGTAAPLGVPGAGLDGPALAFAVSAAPAGDLRHTFSRGSSFGIKGLTQPGSCGILSVVRRY